MRRADEGRLAQAEQYLGGAVANRVHLSSVTDLLSYPGELTGHWSPDVVGAQHEVASAHEGWIRELFSSLNSEEVKGLNSTLGELKHALDDEWIEKRRE